MRHFPLLRSTTITALVVILCGLLSSLALAWQTNGQSAFLPLVLHHTTPKPVSLFPILISEVAYNPTLNEPEKEWLELYPTDNVPIDLNQLSIGDEEMPQGSEGMYRFPKGSLSTPGKSIVIANRAVEFQAVYGFQPDFEFIDSIASVQNMEKVTSWSGGSINMSNSGDEVLIMDREGTIIDSVSWGSSTFAFNPSLKPVKDGNSIERVPANLDSDQAIDWVEQPFPSPGRVHLSPLTPTPTLTATPSRTPTFTPTMTPSLTPKPCSPEVLLISEVLYNPADTVDPIGEWIELFNPGDRTIELDCYKLGDEELQGGGEGMLVFPSGEISLLPRQGVVVIAFRADAFLATFGFLPDFEIFDSSASVPDMGMYASWASGNLNLSNSGDEVIVLGNQDQVVDKLSWGDSTFAFTPSIPLVPEGYSLERRPANRDRDIADDWNKLAIPNPGIVNLSIPSQTPTSTSTQTQIPTVSRTPTPTKTAVFTRTPTPTRTQTATRTPTSTRTTTPVLSATPTRTATSTRTPTLTRTVTPTRTPTLTRTPTPTKTPYTELVINEIHARPANMVGDANHDGTADSVEDEFIEFVNSTGAPLDLSGWQIQDGLATRHLFPPNTQLPTGCSVLVFGGGSPQGDFGHSVVQVASTGNLSLNDMGDTITLFDNSGKAWAFYAYGQEADDGQSITRDPDIFGPDPLIKHTLAEGSQGALFSPGTRVNGLAFTGCP